MYNSIWNQYQSIDLSTDFMMGEIDDIDGGWVK